MRKTFLVCGLAGTTVALLRPERKEAAMLHYALVFFVIALIAAALGFGGVAGMSAQIGWLFAVLAVVFVIVGLLSGRGPRTMP